MRNSLSVSDIDAYIDAIYQDEDEIIQSGIYRHVAILREKYPNVFIAVNEGNPVCAILDPHGVIGFERGLIALKENPGFMAELTYKLYEAFIPRMKALKTSGADGYIGSETYCSCDLISPETYKDIIYPAQKKIIYGNKKDGVISVRLLLRRDSSNFGLYMRTGSGCAARGRSQKEFPPRNI